MEQLPQDIEQINSKLIAKFGYEHDKPKFRIVWSDNELEYRQVYYLKGMQLIHPQIILTRKYNYIHERYILERYIIDSAKDNLELITHNGCSYEPVWVFEDKNLEFVRPFWRAVEVLALAAEGGIGDKKTLKDYMSDDEKALEKEVAYFEDMLDDGTNYKNQKVNFVKPVYINNTDMKEK